MENHTFKERRNFIRFFSQLKARYRLPGESADWHECTIININRKGLCVKLFPHAKIETGTPIHLETFFPSDLDLIAMEGVIKWSIFLTGGYALCGIELDQLLDENKLAGLCSIYSGKNKNQD